MNNDPLPTGPMSRAPHNGTPTSKAAAEAIAPTAATLRAKVLAFIRECGERGATDEEIQNALDMVGNTERPRRGELSAAMLIGQVWVTSDGTAAPLTRKTRSGRQAVVWRAV